MDWTCIHALIPQSASCTWQQAEVEKFVRPGPYPLGVGSCKFKLPPTKNCPHFNLPSYNFYLPPFFEDLSTRSALDPPKDILGVAVGPTSSEARVAFMVEMFRDAI